MPSWGRERSFSACLATLSMSTRALAPSEPRLLAIRYSFSRHVLLCNPFAMSFTPSALSPEKRRWISCRHKAQPTQSAQAMAVGLTSRTRGATQAAECKRNTQTLFTRRDASCDAASGELPHAPAARCSRAACLQARSPPAAQCCSCRGKARPPPPAVRPIKRKPPRHSVRHSHMCSRVDGQSVMGTSLVMLDELSDYNRGEGAHAGGGEVEHVRHGLD